MKHVPVVAAVALSLSACSFTFGAATGRPNLRTAVTDTVIAGIGVIATTYVAINLCEKSDVQLEKCAHEPLSGHRSDTLPYLIVPTLLFAGSAVYGYVARAHHHQ